MDAPKPQPHGLDGELREPNDSCRHNWVLKNNPAAKIAVYRKGGILCGHCGVWWPGHDLPDPEPRTNIDPDYRTVERDDEGRAREPLPPRYRPFTANWSDLK